MPRRDQAARKQEAVSKITEIQIITIEEPGSHGKKKKKKKKASISHVLRWNSR